MRSPRFEFARGNLEKLIAIPKYLLAVVLSWFVPRIDSRWVFGSGVGVGEGALAVARQLRAEDPEAQIKWIVADDAEAETARTAGFDAVLRTSRQGFWATLRAGVIVVTHGLGDVNRFGIFGGLIVQLWHGAPLKRLHLDSPVTTRVQGPRLFRSVLERMYRLGANEVDLYVAGSPIAADRLRSAFRVAPGRVRVLGDPRDDELVRRLGIPEARDESRAEVVELITAARVDATDRLILYAPTWRDGAADPGAPTVQEISLIGETLARLGARLIVRSHPLGESATDDLLGDRVHRLSANDVRDITPLLGAFDAVITDYSSIAVDFALTGRPIVWFAPDLTDYLSSRGLYEPLEVTSRGRLSRSWGEAMSRLFDVMQEGGAASSQARADTRALAAQFFSYPEGGAAQRVLAEVRRLRAAPADLIPDNAVFFESFYGRQVGCNPLSIDRELARRYPDIPRYWSVTSEAQRVPDGAVPLLVGGREWLIARRRARLIVVNDWLRYGFRRRAGQTVLQTWHGTMLKHLALGRPGVSLRTRLAIRRESRRWNLLLSQNPHSTEQFRRSYAYRGEILESGYPRNDRLAHALVGTERNPIEVKLARARLGIHGSPNVLVYAPTWRDGGIEPVDALGVRELSERLGDEWTVVVRGHTRTHAFGGYPVGDRVIDASRHDDVNDVIIAATVIVTDYSSLMFDAAVARVPQLFAVPDLAEYRDRERGFTFDFENDAPGPLLTTAEEVVRCAQDLAAHGDEAPWVVDIADRADAWRERFTPHDDGAAARRVVDALEERGALPSQ